MTNIAPAKAKDLKNSIAWGTENPFAGISSYLTDEWALEPKLDGARMRLFLGEDKNLMDSGSESVNGGFNERSDNFPHLRDLPASQFAGTQLDGEMMPPVNSITTPTGVTTKGPLATIVAMTNSSPKSAVVMQKQYGNAVFMAFDVVRVQGTDVTHLPYTQRREMLEVIVGHLNKIEPTLQMTTQLEATAENIQAALDSGFEGVMLKKKNGIYRPGARMAEWQKVKRMSTGDFFIIGSVDGKNRHAGKVGSLQVAYMGADGKPVHVADVRGFDDATGDMLTDPETGKVKQSYIGKVIEVMGQGRTKNNRIRHPHFVRWREDKNYLDCDVTQIELFTEV